MNCLLSAPFSFALVLFSSRFVSGVILLNDHQLQAGGFKARRAKPPTESEGVLKTVVLNHGPDKG